MFYFRKLSSKIFINETFINVIINNIIINIKFINKNIFFFFFCLYINFNIYITIIFFVSGRNHLKACYFKKMS